MIAVSEQCMSFVDNNDRYHVASKDYESLFSRAVQAYIGKTVAEHHGEKVFSEIHAEKVKVEHFANHDPLTELANRRA